MTLHRRLDLSGKPDVPQMARLRLETLSRLGFARVAETGLAARRDCLTLDRLHQTLGYTETLRRATRSYGRARRW